MFTNKHHVNAWCRVLVMAAAGLLLAACQSGGNLDAGAGYLATGKYRSAYIEAKKVLQENQSNAQAWLLLGKSSLMLGQAKDALADFEKAKLNGLPVEQWAVPLGQAMLTMGQNEQLLQALPAGQQGLSARVAAAVEVLRGSALQSLGKLDQAQAAYTQALKLHAGNTRALVGLARLAMASKDFDAAQSWVQKALAAGPDDPVAWTGKAELARAQDDFTGAAAAYTKALGLDSRNWLPRERLLARLRLTGIQVRQQDFKAAMANIEKLDKMAPDLPGTLYLHAAMLYRQGHLNEAVDKLQKVLRVDPKNVPAQLLMGAINYADSNFSQAEMHLSNVMGLDRDNTAARKLLALTYYREGRASLAVNTLRPLAGDKVSDAAILSRLQRAVEHRVAAPAGAGSAGTRPRQALASIGAMLDQTSNPRFATVRKLLQEGHPDQAIKVVKAVPTGDPATESERARWLVLAYAQDKQVDQAVDKAAAQVASNPKSNSALLLYGTILVVDHQYTKAQAQFEQVLEMDADNLSAQLNLGNLELLQGHYKEAKGHYQAVLKHSPNNSVALLALGKLAASQNNRAEAIDWFNKTIMAAPESPSAYLHLIAMYSQDGRFDQAVDVAKRLAKANPDNPAALNAIGATELNAGHPDKALQPLQQAVQAAPDNAAFRINLARAQVQLKDVASARANLERVVRTHPAQVQAVTLLAAMHMQQHDLPGALKLVRALQKQPSRKLVALTLEGDLYMADKAYPKAAKAYRDALKVKDSRALVIKYFQASAMAGADDPAQVLRDWLADHSQDTTTRLLLGSYYLSMAKDSSAADQYEKVLKAYPSSIIALNNLAWLYTKQGNPQALDMAARAHKLSPASPDIADTYAWALVSADRADEAVPLLRKAVKDAPKVATIQYHLAVALSRSGDKAGARATLEALRASGARYPEQRAAQRLSAELEVK